ncbi:family 1 glycosylhydrolase [Enorma phocaeensis]|uniref:Family 1 glycosylhydrolase n=1 Tax=Enorma phocaeensis TaxID=1871019 RepID=A0ABT7VA88_9ACTN|nr:family 1 glycosylhydrolase [Enorma phocaeensis]MDM8275418.1 family 1 glycosylhydrolase [Enorma phocaeensis]
MWSAFPRSGVSYTPSFGATPKGVCRHSSIRATLRSALVDTSYVAHRGIELDMSASELSAIASMRNDFSAFSYYRSQCVSASGITEDTPATSIADEGHVKNPTLQANEWGWEIDPLGFRHTLTEMYERCGLPVFPIENGIGWRERLPEDGSPVADDYRVDCHRSHIQALKDAVELDGAEVIGYLGWGLIDIPSSSGDIEKRYGAVYVDYDAASGERLKRIPKKSFTWFKRAYESNGEDLG